MAKSKEMEELLSIDREPEMNTPTKMHKSKVKSAARKAFGGKY